MKKNWLIIFVFTLFANMSYCLNWAAPGATWYYTFNQQFSFGYLKIEKLGDTLISGIQCDVLQKTQFGYTWPGYYDTLDLGREYIYEVNNIVKVYRDSTFWTLYDFTALPGSLWSCAGNKQFCPNVGEFEVDTIGSQIINGDILKIVHTIPVNNSQWEYLDNIIEKIGCHSYMFPEAICVADGQEGGILRCYYDSSGWSYHSGTTSTCDFINSIENINTFANFDVYPNPVNDVLFFKFLDDFSCEIKYVDIYDIAGRNIKKIYMLNKESSVSTKDIKEGIYTIIFYLKNSSHSFKKIFAVKH